MHVSQRAHHHSQALIRVPDQLKTHRRDQLIEWIKGLLAVPFVLLSQPTATYGNDRPAVNAMVSAARARYGEIMHDLELLIQDHIACQKNNPGSSPSKLKLLVPSVGLFFTPLPLRDAFAYQDARRRMSSRRFVAPSFNDIRLTLNTAQVMSLVRTSRLELVTFEGDVTLYDDGESLKPDNPCIPRILNLMRKGTRIGIVTAAGYTEARDYYLRLSGLLDAIAAADPSGDLENRLVVMGGESNFLFTYTAHQQCRLEAVPEADWRLPEMSSWTEENVTALLDVGEAALRDCVECLGLPVQVLRKKRAVGIFPSPGVRLAREQLEETVLVVQRVLETSEVGKRIPFCAFNGGNDVFVDVGDKSYGVMSCQAYFGGIEGGRTLHVGDQFLSAGANDFKARLACTTAWVASPTETCNLLDEIQHLGSGEDIAAQSA
ncbi:IMP 5'-nucleotidase [Friedmanniomyces endolithicus]|uniref:IMP-specific 5'-nucleotidase 1 n=1 Tax=Friedmanniomyces endolithicus TaxID=329885 RepID=A0AAN6QU79_9PEZI|nr:IMP 5'-nucleotidase [Friedmanniomyces endolithicus]